MEASRRNDGKVFFDLRGVDFNDDDAVNAAALRVWEQFVKTQSEDATGSDSAVVASGMEESN